MGLCLDNDPPIVTPADIPSGIAEDSPLWFDYVQEAEQQDNERIANWNQMMDVLLVFVSLS